MKLANRPAGKPSWFASIISVGVIILVFACRGQILSEPVGDLDPVLAQCPSAEFDTLDGWPRTTTHIRESRNQLSTLNPDKIIERFDLEEGNTVFTFNLFSNSTGAASYYELFRSSRPSVAPLKLEKVVGGNVRGLLRHVIRPRAGGGGVYAPMDYYISDAMFQLRNAVVEVEVRLERKDARDMEAALKRLAEIVGSPPTESRDKK